MNALLSRAFVRGMDRPVQLTLALILLAVMCPTVAAMLDGLAMKRYPATSRRVILPDGRTLNVFSVKGAADSTPTVIIEAGSADDSASWLDILRHVSTFTAAAAYDRAGQGWSDPARTHRTISDRAVELKLMLLHSGLRGPFVLVGHSYGGYIVRMLARSDPNLVAGLVLIEASEEGFAFSASGRNSAAAFKREAYKCWWLARLGVLRTAVAFLPDNWVSKVCGGIAGKPGYVKAVRVRGARFAETIDEMTSYNSLQMELARLGGPNSLKDFPVAVVTRANRAGHLNQPEELAWFEGQDRLCLLSEVSQRFTALTADHNVQYRDPQTVLGAIQWVWEKSQGRLDLK